jgi:hypothetical protein
MRFPCRFSLVALFLIGRVCARAAEPSQPGYDIALRLDPAARRADAVLRVTWVNPGPAPVGELLFDAHAHYRPPHGADTAAAKVLELARVAPADALDPAAAPLTINRVESAANAAELASHFRDDGTTLEVNLPQPLAAGERVAVDLHLTMRLPERQGRWGQWGGVTTLAGWLPTLADRGPDGWRPAPFVPWFQAVRHAAGVYQVRLRLPADQVIACSGGAKSASDVGGGWRDVDAGPIVARDFALVATRQYRELTDTVGPLRLRVLYLPGHEPAARRLLAVTRTAVTDFAEWFGPFPFPELTIAETHLGWHARSCPGLVLVDERIVALPGFAAGYAEYVLTQQIAQQWWGNAVGTDEAAEPYLAAGLAAHAAHRLLDRTRGRNSSLIGDPTGKGWLPGVGRADFRMSMVNEAAARGEPQAAGRPAAEFEDPARLWGLAAERGGKVFAMLEARVGERAFLDFSRKLTDRYNGRVLRTADLERELAEQTSQPWDNFFRDWVYGRGATDWAVEDVKVTPHPPGPPPPQGGKGEKSIEISPPPPLWGRGPGGEGVSTHRVTITVQQKGEITEPTVLAVRLAGDKDYTLRLPIDPAAGELSFPESRAKIEPLADQRIRVTVDLPRPPAQVAIDPDGVLLDRDPANNVWKPEVRWRLTPLYTFLDETDLTCAHDHWNIIVGPWAFDANFEDPWFTRATILGGRIGAYRTQEFQGGAYIGWRPDYRDLAAGIDFTLPHWPFPKTEVGFNVEHHIAEVTEGGADLNRIAVYGRYIIDDTASFYLPPMHYVETFLSHQNNFLPEPRMPEPDGIRFNNMTDVGLHYHLDLLTPYWDPDRGVRVDATVAGGVAVQPWREGSDSRGSGQALGQVSWVQVPPECLGLLSETRLACRLYGAAALPDRGEFYSLGGNLLFRGFDLKQRQGADVWVASAEWRVPLLRRLDWDVADHTVGLRQVALAPFYDVGNAYLAGHGVGSVAQAVGCGLRLDVAWLSFVERTTLRFDVAKTINASTPTQFWFGIQHPF